MLNVMSHSQSSMSNMLSVRYSQGAIDLLNQITIVEDSQEAPFPKSFTTHVIKKTTH